MYQIVLYLAVSLLYNLPNKLRQAETHRLSGGLDCVQNPDFPRVFGLPKTMGNHRWMDSLDLIFKPANSYSHMFWPADSY